jgi:hypothetical protein
VDSTDNTEKDETKLPSKSQSDLDHEDKGGESDSEIPSAILQFLDSP